MDNTSNPIPLFECLLDLMTHGLNDASVVTSRPRSGVGVSIVDMFPVCRVKADGVHFDEDVVVAKLGDRHILDSGFAFFNVYNCFCRHCCGGRSG